MRERPQGEGCGVWLEEAHLVGSSLTNRTIALPPCSQAKAGDKEEGGEGKDAAADAKGEGKEEDKAGASA